MTTNPHTAYKACIKCGADLILGDTWSDGQRKSNNYCCRSCMAAKGREFYANNKRHVIETAKRRRHRDLDRIREYWREWREQNRDQVRGYEERYRLSTYASAEKRACRLLSACRVRSRNAGLAFDLTAEWLTERLARGACEVTGIPFDFTPLPPRSERKSRTPAFAPSLDRIERGGGYTQDNVQVVVFIYNVARSDFDDDDLLTLARALAA